MKEFIEKLIEELDELIQFEENRDEDEDKEFYTDCEKAFDDGASSGRFQALMKVKRVVLHLAEKYKECYKPSCKDCEVYDKEKHYCPKWCEVIKRTTNELAEEYKGGWIPCSERLPEESDEYLITWRDRATCKNYVEVNEYDADEGKWLDCICQAGLLGYDIIAWMPIPEPFQKGE